MEFTRNERLILNYYIRQMSTIDEMEYWLEDQGSTVLGYSDFTACDIKDESLKGVIGSLVKKGILTPDADFDAQMKKEGFEQALFLSPDYVRMIIEQQQEILDGYLDLIEMNK